VEEVSGRDRKDSEGSEMKTIITVQVVFDDESEADVFVDGLASLEDEGVFPTGANIKREYDYQWASDSDKYIDNTFRGSIVKALDEMVGVRDA
tara:strand:- start:227 stop:505 length:279 start_codon:yes stop_codon:yes gene_type:complete